MHYCIKIVFPYSDAAAERNRRLGLTMRTHRTTQYGRGAWRRGGVEGGARIIIIHEPPVIRKH